MRRWLPVLLLTVFVAATTVGAYVLGHSIGREQQPAQVIVHRYEPVICNISPGQRVSGPNGLYLDLMKLSLTDLLYETDPRYRSALTEGTDCKRGLTMIGMRRLENIQTLMERTITAHTPGDFIEAGVWRGGACIFMRGVLEAQGITDRFVWVADSFEGLPFPIAEERSMAVSMDVVKDNFRRYELLDGQVKFLKGWFKDTLPSAPIRSLAVLRIDADLYDSTMDALKYLYPKLSAGGYVIIDDYSYYPPCAKAVDEFRKQHAITTPIVKIDWTGVYWQKLNGEPGPRA